MKAHELVGRIKNHEVKSRDVVGALLRRIDEVEEDINAFITVLQNEAIQSAERVDEKAKKGEKLGALAGIPVAVKDVICVSGSKTTCGSKILENFIAPYDATVSEKLKAADAVIIGKTNMDEFAMGSSTESSYFGITRNPHDLDCVPGGSSGGSAAAVAANETILGVGSDTGGSIRQPAAFCGIVGLKPTYGRVSRYGLIAYGSSLDQIGPMTKDVRDAALLLNVIAGHDQRDSTSFAIQVPDYLSRLQNGVEGIKLGLPKEYFAEGLDSQVRDAIFETAELLKEQGAEIKDVSLPYTKYAVAAYYIIATAEASANLARYDGVKYGYRADGSEDDLIQLYIKTRSQGFGEEVKRRIMLGTYALSAGYYDAYYLKAQKVRTLIKRDIENALSECDLLITPVSPTPAFKIGEKMDDPLELYLSDIYTISVNMAGIPAISIPCGTSSDGLPIALQILGRPFEEDTILRVAYAAEQGLIADVCL